MVAIWPNLLIWCPTIPNPTKLEALLNLENDLFPSCLLTPEFFLFHEPTIQHSNRRDYMNISELKR